MKVDFSYLPHTYLSLYIEYEHMDLKGMICSKLYLCVFLLLLNRYIRCFKYTFEGVHQVHILDGCVSPTISTISLII
jgi:hypothetical protein